MLSTRSNTAPKPTFLYDDCCPLCRGYTATFAGLGWTDRAPFSKIDDATVTALDFDRARHQIPLVDSTDRTVRYGLDGILGVVTENMPALGPVVGNRVVRRGLDAFYWMVTYNRRHIVAAPPPLSGVDCAPDFNPDSVRAYLAFTAVSGIALVAAHGAVAPTALVLGVASTVAVVRHDRWNINNTQAAGHVGSVVLAAGIIGAAAAGLGAGRAVTAAAVLATGARKIWLRRWMMTNPNPNWKSNWVHRRRLDRASYPKATASSSTERASADSA